MPRKIKIKESIPLQTETKVYSEEEPAPDPLVDEDGSLKLTLSQEREILTELKLTDFAKRKAAMRSIYPVLYVFRAGRIREIEAAGLAEQRKARQAHKAVGRARRALDGLGKAACEAVQARDPDDPQDADVLSVTTTGLTILGGLLEKFVNSHPMRKKGPAGSLALEIAVASLRETFTEAHRGRRKAAGSFEDFCETTLRLVAPHPPKLGRTAIANAVRKVSRRS